MFVGFSKGIVMVEWDDGDRNLYQFDEDICMFSIKKVDEPRILEDELIAVGCRVERGIRLPKIHTSFILF